MPNYRRPVHDDGEPEDEEDLHDLQASAQDVPLSRAGHGSIGRTASP